MRIKKLVHTNNRRFKNWICQNPQNKNSRLEETDERQEV